MKPPVLMVAYACDPQGTGEHWLGWGWAEQAAQRFAVDLITTPRARTEVEKRSPALGITPHFVEAPAWLRQGTEALGGSWLRKLGWQRRAARLAESLHRERRFALVHQTTFHTFRVPFLATRLGVPAVWGPIAGGEHVPPGFGGCLGPARWGEAARAGLNRLWLRLPAIQRSLRRARVLFVSNRTTRDFLPADCRAKAQVVPPNALRAEDEDWQPPLKKPEAAATFRLLYVGNCVATRALPLVFDALRQCDLGAFELSIVGAGPALGHWRRRAAALGLESRVRFIGKVPHDQLQNYYALADVLVFPALRDSGGSALLEAMARQVPAVCFDWGGPGEMITEDCGIKVPVRSPEQTVKSFAAALQRLKDEPAFRQTLARAARDRALSVFGWVAKRQLLETTYARLIGGP